MNKGVSAELFNIPYTYIDTYNQINNKLINVIYKLKGKSKTHESIVKHLLYLCFENKFFFNTCMFFHFKRNYEETPKEYKSIYKQMTQNKFNIHKYLSITAANESTNSIEKSNNVYKETLEEQKFYTYLKSRITNSFDAIYRFLQTKNKRGQKAILDNLIFAILTSNKKIINDNRIFIKLSRIDYFIADLNKEKNKGKIVKQLDNLKDDLIKFDKELVKYQRSFAENETPAPKYLIQIVQKITDYLRLFEKDIDNLLQTQKENIQRIVEEEEADTHSAESNLKTLSELENTYDEYNKIVFNEGIEKKYEPKFFRTYTARFPDKVKHIFENEKNLSYIPYLETYFDRAKSIKSTNIMQKQIIFKNTYMLLEFLIVATSDLKKKIDENFKKNKVEDLSYILKRAYNKVERKH